MEILIIGGAGVIGRKLAAALSARGRLRGREISRLVLADIVAPEPVAAPFPVAGAVCDIGQRAQVEALIGPQVDVIFLLAAVPSGGAEADFDLGLSSNLHGVLNVLERCRALGSAPVLVFSSSIAVYGGDVPDPITEASHQNPQTSYGTQKAVAELLVNDWSRRGFIDGRAFRLPTIVVRPGRPNLAASSFMSSIFREPLNGQEAVCPVGRDFAHYYLSPGLAAENLVLGAEIGAEALGTNRAMLMPGRSWTIGEMIEAMTAVAGPGPAKLIRWEDRPEVRRIVSGWRSEFRPDRALGFGMRADASFEDSLRQYLQEDFGRG